MTPDKIEDNMGDEKTVILVMDRGHVKAARISRHPDLAFHWLLSPGRTIRKWGTTQGLNELVNGPLAETKLDALAISAVPYRAIIEIIDISEAAWAPYLIMKEVSSAQRSHAKKSHSY